MKRVERREPHRHLHTQPSVCTSKKLSCRQTRKNCLLKLLLRASGSLKMRLARTNGERRRYARKREARRRGGDCLNPHSAPNSKCAVLRITSHMFGELYLDLKFCKFRWNSTNRFFLPDRQIFVEILTGFCRICGQS